MERIMIVIPSASLCHCHCL